jgi:hypothetical protein
LSGSNTVYGSHHIFSIDHVDCGSDGQRCSLPTGSTAYSSYVKRTATARRSDKALDRGRPGPSQARRATAVLPRADGLGCFTVRRQSGWMSYCLILECSRAGRALPHQNAPSATSVCQSITRVPPRGVTQSRAGRGSGVNVSIAKRDVTKPVPRDRHQGAGHADGNDGARLVDRAGSVRCSTIEPGRAWAR